MTDQHETRDAREADDMGEKPDLGRKPDALTEALSGSGMGSDTRAGSLQGGAATGSDDDPDQDAINETLASEGMASTDRQSPPADPNPVKNTGEDQGGSARGKSGQADAATG
ncbi:MAG: ribonuclease [Brevundimonas sp.]|uniref:ribonuclease n=1 Tax=Brevundimonas sp. TaxID=1871086 RepID=UPI002487DD6B|nr:ribonuclease [Brevundimonas sp.]MDI1325183.1 ribonuclease [Brevundimonas sp.]